MTKTPVAFVVALIAIFSVHANAQSDAPTHPFNLTLNESSRFVLEGHGSLAGISIQSPSGSLVPGPAAPFQFALSATPHDIAYGNLGAGLVVDGEVTLQSGWDPLGARDVTYELGIGARPVGPFSLFESDVAEERFQVAVNEEHFFVVTGQGDLSSIEFSSPSGSLVPGPQAPFEFSVGRPHEFHVVYGNTEGAVAVDGELTLQAGWNPTGVPDVQVEYGVQGLDRTSGSMPVTYRPGVTQQDVVRVTLDDDYQVILNGNGQRVSEFVLFSEGASLVPSVAGAPFSPLVAGDSNNDGDSIRFTTDSFVEVDGAVRIDAGWNRLRGLRDVRYSYIDFDTGEKVGPFPFLGTTYPEPPVTNHIGLSIDRDRRNLKVEGYGQELRSLKLLSPSGSLLPGTSTGPFTSIAENSPRQVQFQSDGFVRLDGVLTLDTKYDMTVSGEDIQGWYEQVGFENVRGPVEIADIFYPRTLRSPLSFSINSDSAIRLSGVGQKLDTVTVTSESGALVPITGPSSFVVLVNTEHEITLQASGLGRTIRNLTLPISWDETIADLNYSYSLKDVTGEFGPSTLDNYPSSFSIGTIRASFSSTSVGLFDGHDREITGFAVTSESGSLSPASDTGLFSVVEQSPTRMEFELDEALAVGSFLSLPFRWEGDPDLDFEWHSTSGNALIEDVRYVDNFVPEPSSQSMMLMLLGLSLVFRRQRRLDGSQHIAM